MLTAWFSSGKRQYSVIMSRPGRVVARPAASTRRISQQVLPVPQTPSLPPAITRPGPDPAPGSTARNGKERTTRPSR
jgi:hypothetical protein